MCRDKNALESFSMLSTDEWHYQYRMIDRMKLSLEVRFRWNFIIWFNPAFIISYDIFLSQLFQIFHRIWSISYSIFARLSILSSSRTTRTDNGAYLTQRERTLYIERRVTGFSHVFLQMTRLRTISHDDRFTTNILRV